MHICIGNCEVLIYRSNWEEISECRFTKTKDLPFSIQSTPVKEAVYTLIALVKRRPDRENRAYNSHCSLIGMHGHYCHRYNHFVHGINATYGTMLDIHMYTITTMLHTQYNMVT